MPRSRGQRQRVANLLRKARIFSPPVSVEEVAGVLNVRIQRSPLPNELSGLLLRHKDCDDPIIGVMISSISWTDANSDTTVNLVFSDDRPNGNYKV